MSSSTEICNMAISHIGEGKDIDNFLTDPTPEATACRRFFNIALETVLRDFDWPFARVYAALNLVATDPTIEWRFSYRYPADCLFLRKILTGERRATMDNVQPFDTGVDVDGKLLYTDMPDVQVKYTKKITNTDFLTPDFTVALSYYLASLIGPRLSVGDPYKQAAKASQFYAYHMSRARMNAANEEQMDKLVESEFIRAREGSLEQTDRLGRFF